MAIKEGDVVDYDGEVYTVVRIYSTLGLMQSSALWKSMDGKRLLMTRMSSLNNSFFERKKRGGK